MTYINPLVAAPLAGAQAQQQAAADKTRQVRRAQTVARHIAAESDRLEHQVENAEALAGIHDDGQPRKRPRQPPLRHAPDERAADGEEPDTEPHIDVRA